MIIAIIIPLFTIIISMMMIMIAAPGSGVGSAWASTRSHMQ